MAADRSNLPEGLLSDVKTDLGITWEDEATDKRISGHIANGIAYLNGKKGAEADYTVDGLPRALLFDYVRYARDYALDVFEGNYRSQILALQNDRKVKNYEEGTV